MSYGLLLKIVGLNSDPYIAIPFRAILLSKSDLNLVPWAIVDGKLGLIIYYGDSVRVPYQIHMLLKLIHWEETIPEWS